MRRATARPRAFSPRPLPESPRLQKLIHGLHQFHEDYFRPLQQLFEKLAHGQTPETLFITCSDSRIDPNLLTGSKPGDLFIVRNAGNIIPPHGSGVGGEAATIEFAVAGLGVKDIIVCGHSHCGAMNGVLHPESLAKLPTLAAWLTHAEDTRRIVRENYSHLEGPDLLTAAVEENVLVQLEHLRTLPAVAARLASGDLHLHGWVYELETGEVFSWDPSVRQFITLSALPWPGDGEGDGEEERERAEPATTI